MYHTLKSRQYKAVQVRLDHMQSLFLCYNAIGLLSHLCLNPLSDSTSLQCSIIHPILIPSPNLHSQHTSPNNTQPYNHTDTPCTKSLLYQV
jgi:hypothetical protein